ncbi:MAG TPA: cation diffusion facilitator family transporter [Candidatus Cloacimonadota bacterium]|jgi:cobalt-zinc-cadmium efflux system protein|nr:cation diffusion facilitator family transporter [Candidatus Cloacimonadales bacterium]HOQ80082.1 cation diffusion facilitator family transporter [Candidatus Cloacimonadota bacterium]
MTHNHLHDHDHNHHDHHHHHHIDPEAISPSQFRFVALLNFVITLAEFIGGFLSGSLALVSDAVHNLSDTISIVLSYLAYKISKKTNDHKRTFGYKRAEVIAAFINSTSLIIISVYLLYEAGKRLYNPEEIKGWLMLIVATIGLISNLISMLLLHKSSKHNMNIKSAYLHILGDTISSVGVILGGIAIILWKIYWIDPLVTALIAIYIAKESIGIIKTTSNIIMQGAPNVFLPDIQEDITKIPDVENVHHVHAWMINENTFHFEAHIEVKDKMVSELNPIYDEIRSILTEKYNFNHITIQFECRLCQNKELIYTGNESV